jgi:hypothetical protein
MTSKPPRVSEHPALLGTLEEVRSALEDVLERSDRAVEEETRTELGEGQGDDTTAPPVGAAL